MPNSPTNCDSNPQNYQISNTQKRLCDFCGESVALVYCRADSAKLCLSCDREVHSTNQLFTKHTRFQLCDSCDSSPASILCLTENSVLCQNCDYEHHRCIGSSPNHDRRPLEGFSGCPSVVDLCGAIGLEDLNSKSSNFWDENDRGFSGGNLFSGLLEEENNDGFSDLFVWDAPTMVNLDDLIVSTDRSHNFQAMVVPSLPKDRNLSCGQHKHEMLYQLRELAKFDPSIKQDAYAVVAQHNVADEDKKDVRAQNKIKAYQHDQDQPTFPGNEANPYTGYNDTSEASNEVYVSSALLGSHIDNSVLNSDTHSGMCGSANLAANKSNSQCTIRNESVELPKKVSTRELCSADRDSALSRYKEKKRTRRFEKHIRYESRKLQAENRIRIKGRFAKIDSRMTRHE